MKQIGLIGGISWAATAAYYRELNMLTQRKFGANHSVNLIIRSLNMQTVLDHSSDRRFLENLFESEGKKLVQVGAEAIALGSLTGHCYADLLDGAEVAFVRLDDCIATTLRTERISSAAILATSVALSDRTIMDRIRSFGGCDILTPDSHQRRELDAAIFGDLAHDRCSSRSIETLQYIAKDLADKGAQAIVLGTTELSIARRKVKFPLPVLDAVEIHSRALLDFAAADNEETQNRD